jgi:hypothetical protein
MAYIVMTSSAKMPSSVKHPYRNVAIVEVDDPAIYPAMISEHARNVRRIVRHFGPRATGKTERCAYRVALAEAETMAAKLNADENKTA